MLPSDFSTTQTSDVISALEAELSQSSKPQVFTVRRTTRVGGIYQIEIESRGTPRRFIDDSLEGSKAWWTVPQKGAADILSVVPEEDQINLWHATAPAPKDGTQIFLYPPKYIEPLLEIWRAHQGGNELISWGNNFHRTNERIGDALDSPRMRRTLRDAQRKSFELLQWRRGFLWGPPGTGKTTTLAAQMAQVLVKTNKRILVVCSTNSAVDTLLLALDDILQELCDITPERLGQIKSSISRFGTRFAASRYQGREHLLAIGRVDRSSFVELRKIELAEPDKTDVLNYELWKQSRDQARARINALMVEKLRNTRLAAMTGTRATFAIEQVSNSGPWDLMIIDEASQLSMAQTVVLSSLASQVIFAGDHHQLAPIVTSNEAKSQPWLVESAFILMRDNDPYTCFLDEQSRMAPPISEVVSSVFYSPKRLVVASEVGEDPAWRRARQPFDVCHFGEKNAYAIQVEDDQVWAASQYGGQIRPSSALLVLKLLEDLTMAHPQSDIIVLTPYRSQRAYLRNVLKPFPQVRISTVHSAQGAEHGVVILDTVDADNIFLESPLGVRLFNVAISRTKARFFLLFSASDFQNSTVRKLVTAIDAGLANVLSQREESATLREIIRQSDPIEAAVGKSGTWVETATGERITLKILDISDGFVTTDDPKKPGKNRKRRFNLVILLGPQQHKNE